MLLFVSKIPKSQFESYGICLPFASDLPLNRCILLEYFGKQKYFISSQASIFTTYVNIKIQLGYSNLPGKVKFGIDVELVCKYAVSGLQKVFSQS